VEKAIEAGLVGGVGELGVDAGDGLARGNVVGCQSSADG